MTGDFSKFYWDSCVIIAYLKNEVDKHEDSVPHIQELLRQNMREENQIIGSQFIRLEVLQFTLSQKAEDSFLGFYQYGKNQIWDIDGRVALLAREIVDYYKCNKQVRTTRKGKTVEKSIKAADAVHLATAILHRVDVFHTLDDGGQDGFSLLELNGSVAGHSLAISKPRAPDFTPDFFTPGETESEIILPSQTSE